MTKQTATMNRPTVAAAPGSAPQLAPRDIAVSTAGGGFQPQDIEDAREALARAATHASEPILAARLRLLRHANPSLACPITAQAGLDVNGRAVQARVAATTVTQAIDKLADRTRAQLDRLARYRQHRRGRPWPAREVTSTETAHLRPASDTREGSEGPSVVRHKSYELPRATIDEAAWELDLMDYDFDLFTERETGQDSVLSRGGPTGYRLALAQPQPEWRPDPVVPVTISDQPAAHLTLPQAMQHLDATGLPFVFYTVASGRARLLYRRHDGDYGLIMPAK